MKKLVISALVPFAILCLAASASAQQAKTAKCAHIQIVVDIDSGSGWNNSQAFLAMMDKGGGWVVSEGSREGQNLLVTRGQKLRFNFNDGANHQVNVKPSSKSGKVKVRSGSRPAIVLVDVTGGKSQAAIHFEITGSPNAKAKINGCPGGNFYLEIE